MIELGSEEPREASSGSQSKVKEAKKSRPVKTLPPADRLTGLIGFRVLVTRQIAGYRNHHRPCFLKACQDCIKARKPQVYSDPEMQSTESISGILRGVNSLGGFSAPAPYEPVYHVVIDWGEGRSDLLPLIQGDKITVYGYSSYGNHNPSSEPLDPSFEMTGIFLERPSAR